MKHMKIASTVKPIELVNELESFCSEDHIGEAEQKYRVLEEELWGLENGIYVSIGKLHLPVVADSYKDTNPNGLGDSSIFTVFTNKFFSCDEEKMHDEYYPIHYEHKKCSDNPLEGGVTVINTFGRQNGFFDAIMGQHIPKFLKLYDLAEKEPAMTEALQCIRKAFVEYRKQER
ncbi:hypothetical protein COV15_02450 [Candidatus Woesearchaeota archaeon CG10_big_fil_rev_8_21_14_0_10_34_12]|nr:MAG: hypothetical protein COV15_02450 [Candidatus Woesearchaeota archaeon CG10_big_fil_rev_8_21_14_0_10_34_12]